MRHADIVEHDHVCNTEEAAIRWRILHQFGKTNSRKQHCDQQQHCAQSKPFEDERPKRNRIRIDGRECKARALGARRQQHTTVRQISSTEACRHS